MMDEHTAFELAQPVLEGFFQTLGEASDTSYSIQIEGTPAGSDDLTGLLEGHPVVLRATWSDPELGIALLFRLDDAQRISGGDVTEPNLEPEPAKALVLAAEASLAATLAQAGAGDMPPAQVVLEQPGEVDADALLAALGGAATIVAYRHEDKEGAVGQARIVLDNRMGAFPEAKGSAMPTLSEDELQDILGGDEIPDEPASTATASGNGDRFGGQGNLDMVLDIRLVATARLGRIEMPIAEILELGPGSIVEVGHLVDEPVDLLINDKLIARGDVVVVDEKFGLRITEIISPRERIESLR